MRGEVHEKNKETITERLKQYYEKNKETLVERSKQHYEKERQAQIERQKEKITCLLCGCISRRGDIARHQRTNTATGEGYLDFPVVVSQQANATIKGVEAELTYNWQENGTGGRIFGDASQGTFNSGGNLPLQPAPRLGAEITHQINEWKMNATYIHAYQQTRLASFEIGPTPSYNLLNAGLSYTEKIQAVSWTGYLRLSNLLNQDIRYATTPETVRLYAPQPGRSLMVGVKAAF